MFIQFLENLFCKSKKLQFVKFITFFISAATDSIAATSILKNLISYDRRTFWSSPRRYRNIDIR